MYDYQTVESISERLKRYIKDATESLNIKSEVKVSFDYDGDLRGYYLTIRTNTALGCIEGRRFLDEHRVSDAFIIVAYFVVDEMLQEVTNFIMEKATCGY